jgi:hypothetical protein
MTTVITFPLMPKIKKVPSREPVIYGAAGGIQIVLQGSMDPADTLTVIAGTDSSIEVLSTFANTTAGRVAADCLGEAAARVLQIAAREFSGPGPRGAA